MCHSYLRVPFWLRIPRNTSKHSLQTSQWTIKVIFIRYRIIPLCNHLSITYYAANNYASLNLNDKYRFLPHVGEVTEHHISQRKTFLSLLLTAQNMKFKRNIMK